MPVTVTVEELTTTVAADGESVAVTATGEPGAVAVAAEQGPAGPQGPPGADGGLFGAITAAYTVQAGKVLPGGWFRDQVSGLGTVQLSLTDSAGVAYPVARYFADAAAGALLQVKWFGGVRVYRRAAGVSSFEFDLTFGPSLNVPAAPDDPADTLPAVGTAVRVTVLPAATDVPTAPAESVLTTDDAQNMTWRQGQPTEFLAGGNGVGGPSFRAITAADVSGLTYTHTQGSADTTWTVNHNLGSRPTVEVRSPGGVVVLAEVTHTSDSQCVVSFSAAQTGTVYCSL